MIQSKINTAYTKHWTRARVFICIYSCVYECVLISISVLWGPLYVHIYLFLGHTARDTWERARLRLDNEIIFCAMVLYWSNASISLSLWIYTHIYVYIRMYVAHERASSSAKYILYNMQLFIEIIYLFLIENYFFCLGLLIYFIFYVEFFFFFFSLCLYGCIVSRL